ncbi:type II toxin-antitoxin system death-on-curing family toxin [Dermacoccus nishinomiyaensis]|nr:type II toxin-antitoxin system death-on-curing family toxin [Dermacoccus nishinomiyaensis]
MLESALARPRAVVFGEDVYPGILMKAAALVHSLAKNRALVDGNKRTALGAFWLFLALDGTHLVGSDDERYEFMLDVAAGGLDDVGVIAERLRDLTEPM